MTLNDFATHLPLDLAYVIRNAGRREGFLRDVWQQEIDALLQRGSLVITRSTDPPRCIRFQVAVAA